MELATNDDDDNGCDYDDNDDDDDDLFDGIASNKCCLLYTSPSPRDS